MDDVMGKIQEILSDKESIQQLSELAQMFMSGSLEKDEATGKTDSENESNDSESNIFGNIDMDFILKLQEIMGTVSQKDKNTDLLLALKPHLNDEKQEKINKAIKILKLLAVWNILKDSGLLKNLL